MSNDQIQIKVEKLEDNFNDQKEVLSKIEQSLQSLVRLEERHIETRAGLDRAFKSIEKIDQRHTELHSIAVQKIETLGNRVHAIEIEQPLTKAFRTHTINTLIGVIMILITAYVGFKSK